MYQEPGNESYGLEEQHEALLKALEKFDELCRNNDIKYSLYGGTMLGAERYQRFVPWDDDADICMTREHYEQLCDVVQNDQSGKFYIDHEKLWVSRFICDTDDRVAFVDIFIWDYISEVSWQKSLKISLLRLMQGMMKLKVDYQRYKGAYKIILFVSYNAGRIFSHHFKAKVYDFISRNCFIGKKKYIHCSNEMFKGVGYIFDRGYMSEYIDVEFADHQFMTTKRYKEVLLKYFGDDYMTPPPMEKRKPTHQGYIKMLNERKKSERN